jgi:hypothetical protein
MLGACEMLGACQMLGAGEMLGTPEMHCAPEILGALEILSAVEMLGAIKMLNTIEMICKIEMLSIIEILGAIEMPLAWHPPSGILHGVREAPEPSRIIFLSSDVLQAAPSAPENFPQSHRSISQHSYHFLEGPQTGTFAYFAPRASLTLRSPHCQLVSYVTPFVDHTVNSSQLLQPSSREICINRHL